MKFTHFGKNHITLSFCISLPPLTYVESIRFCTGMISTLNSPSHSYSTCTKCISHHQNEPRRYPRCTSSFWFWFCYSVLLIVVENTFIDCSGRYFYCLPTSTTFFVSVDDPRIRVSRSLNETELSKRQGPAGPGEEKYIETLVVVDPKMANFHGEDAAKQYALSACNIVC